MFLAEKTRQDTVVGGWEDEVSHFAACDGGHETFEFRENFH
jgi:hypothetical protein